MGKLFLHEATEESSRSDTVSLLRRENFFSVSEAE